MSRLGAKVLRERRAVKATTVTITTREDPGFPRFFVPPLRSSVPVMGFEPFTDDYDYVKTPYEVLLQDGSTVQCWPNGGSLHAMDGSGRWWWPKDRVLVRRSLCRKTLADFGEEPRSKP